MIEKIKWFKGASSENYWFAAILTSGFIKLTLATTATSIGSLDSLEKSQRSITCGLLKVSRKGFEVFLLFDLSMQRRANLPSRRSEDQK